MGTRAEAEPPTLLFSNSSKSQQLSAAAFVEGGVQDACDDSCSICLEPFCDSNPATVTSCKHEYHLQCILEWAQRSKECPMCWQLLSLKDPTSQELLDAVEQEQSPTWPRNSVDGIQFHQVPAFANYADFEERIMQHLAHQLARRGTLQNRLSSMQDEALVHPLNQAPVRTARGTMEQPVLEFRQMDAYAADAASRSHLGSRFRARELERHIIVSEPMEESQPRTSSSDISSLSESLKSRFLVASSKCKETLTRTTRSFKERWQGRNNTMSDFSAQAQEVSADVVRQAFKRISPESNGRENDVPSTSSGSSTLRDGIDATSSKPGASTQTRCTSNNHLEGVVVNGVSPSEAG